MNSRILSILAIIFMASLLASGCVDQEVQPETQQDRLVIAVSILPQAEFVEKIGGDNVRTVVMIPPGADPHAYEPKPSQLVEISNARMYAIVGSGLPFEEVWLDKIKAVNKEMRIVDTSQGIQIREMEAHHHEGEEDEEQEEEHEGTDPHIWLSPENAMIMVENTYNGLVQIDPENQEYYYQNKEQYLDELEQLDSTIRANLSGYQNRNFMVFHPSWGYFAQEYGLNMIPVEIEGKEPSARDLTRLINTAREENISVIFVQPQFSTQSAKAIANEIEAEVIAVDPLSKEYINNMQNVSEIFAKELT